MSVYLDTSAAAKLLVAEPESAALAGYLDGVDSDAPPVSSALLETELRRLATRLGLSQLAVSNVLDRINLVETSRSLFAEAGLLPGVHLRSLDALHLATALRAEASVVIAYDDRLLQHAHLVGLATESPGPATTG